MHHGIVTAWIRWTEVLCNNGTFKPLMLSKKNRYCYDNNFTRDQASGVIIVLLWQFCFVWTKINLVHTHQATSTTSCEVIVNAPHSNELNALQNAFCTRKEIILILLRYVCIMMLIRAMWVYTQHLNDSDTYLGQEKVINWLESAATD